MKRVFLLLLVFLYVNAHGQLTKGRVSITINEIRSELRDSINTDSLHVGGDVNFVTIDSAGNYTGSGDIDIEGDLKYEFVHLFAHKEDTAITPNCPGTDQYVKISPNWRTGWGLDENDGLTYAPDSITIISAGDYYSVFSFTMYGTNAVDFKIAIFKNGAKLYGVRRTTTGAGNYAGGTLAFYLPHLVSGDDLSIWVSNLTAPGTTDPTFTNLNWYFYKMPE